VAISTLPGPETALGPYAARTAVDWEHRASGVPWVVADGSLVKIDLSGFTRLSERLARSELTGAESLNTVLNDVFVVLIDEILSRGGDVLQFGGDALLVWFEGVEHEVRAVAACHAMQLRMGERPAERTSAGPVRLRMSAAVASGALVLTVVGRDHRELLTLGPVATRVELLEKLARSGQVLVDTATASQLPASCVRPVTADAWRCWGAAPGVPVTRTPMGGAGAAEFVPPDVRTLLAAGLPPGEHRRTAVAFIGVGGTDALIASGDMAGAVERVAKVASAVDEAVAATKVAWTATDLMADGAVFLLFAGAPVAREDDEERMLRACRLVAERCSDLGVRIGAHAGRVFAADVGHPARRTYAVIGDTTNLAARLMHRAIPDTVLVTEELFTRSDRDHTVAWDETFFVKGRRRAVVAGALGSRTQPPVRRRTHDLPLVGRDREHDRLAELVDAVAAAPCTGDTALTLVLVAEAGAGKSRLVEDVLRNATEQGLAVLTAVASAFDAETPYGALQSALRAALGVADNSLRATERLAAFITESADLLPLLGLPLGLDLGTTPRVDAIEPQFLASRRNELLAEVLLGAAQGPLLVVLEDLHDLDGASAGLLGALARRAAPGVLGLLLSSRVPLDRVLEDADTWEELRLDPLHPKQTRRLALAAMREDALSDIDLARLVDESGGNPLFLRELVAFSATSDGTLPASAEDVVAARIDTLDPTSRHLLRDASVGGPVMWLDDLADVLGDPTVGDPARWARLADFVAVHPVERGSTAGRPAAQLRFRHDLYRRGAYGGLAVRRRRELHAALADHLISTSESGSAAATIAVHLHEAQRHSEAWQWALQAARAARVSGALHDAAALYTRAIDAGSRAAKPPEDLAVVREELGDVAELIGRYEDADIALRSAARVGPPDVVGRRLVKRAAVLERLGRYRSALGLLTRAEHRLVEQGAAADDTSGRTAGWTALALRRSSVLHRLGRLETAFEVAQDVAAVAELSATALMRADRARALLRLEMIASEAGWPERFDLGEQALASFDGLDQDRELARLLGNLGVTAWESDDWSAALRRYEESVEVYHRVGDVVGAAIAANNAGEILCEQGHLTAAKDVFQEARRIFRAAGHAFGVACTASSLGRVAARDGDHQRAATLLDEAHTSLTAMGSIAFAADARVRQVEAALLAGRPDTLLFAREALEAIIAADAGSVLPLTAARYLAIATARAGDLIEAERLARMTLATATETKVAHEESLALDLLAGLAVLSGRQPEPDMLEKRDLLWLRLGVVATPVYQPIPRAWLGQETGRQT
jgi:class 3 adenylate cyclase/tetratricopeptide (TPR) repeat protein